MCTSILQWHTYSLSRLESWIVLLFGSYYIPTCILFLITRIIFVGLRCLSRKKWDLMVQFFKVTNYFPTRTYDIIYSIGRCRRFLFRYWLIFFSISHISKWETIFLFNRNGRQYEKKYQWIYQYLPLWKKTYRSWQVVPFSIPKGTSDFFCSDILGMLTLCCT